MNPLANAGSVPPPGGMESPPAAGNSLRIKIKLPSQPNEEGSPEPAAPTTPSQKNTKKNVKPRTGDEMEVEGEHDEEYAEGTKARPSDASGKKNRAGRPSGSSSAKNKRNNRPGQTPGTPSTPTSLPVPPSPTPMPPLGISQDVLESANEGSLDESDAAYHDDDSDEDGKPGRGRAKRKGDGKNGKPKRNNIRSARPTEVAAPDMDFFDESDHGSAHKHATDMWKIVDAHFAEFTEEDIKFCTADRGSDAAFTIPKLGVHYSLSMNSDLARSSSRRMLGGGLDQSVDALMPGGGLSSESMRAESITTRLLSALIEENGVSADTFSFDDIDMSQQVDMMGQGEILSEPDTMNIQEMELIDQRIRTELKALALLEEGESTQDAKEDDEICSELRKLQAQLKTQLNSSKKLKAGLLEKVNEDSPKRKAKHDTLRKLRDEEKSLLDKLKRTTKKRKRATDDET